MATGKKFDPDKQDVIDAINEFGGNLHFAARKFRVNHNTLRRYCKKHQELMDLIDEGLEDGDHEKIDLAEDVFVYAMKQKEENLSQAVRAAYGVMMNLGHLRRWKQQHSVEDNYLASSTPMWAFLDGQNKILQQQSSKVTSINDTKLISEAD